jgi:uncharacterized protein YjiS (DUF1127 family)
MTAGRLQFRRGRAKKYFDASCRNWRSSAAFSVAQGIGLSRQNTANSEAIHRPARQRSRIMAAAAGARRHEEAMSTMSLNVMTGRLRRVSRWRQVTQGLAEWQRRQRSRRELRNLSDRCLQDIDMSRIAEMRCCASDLAACKPFWMA